MPILNEQLNWSDISKIPDVRQAFRGAPEKVLLAKESLLCRFITTAKNTSKDEMDRSSSIFCSPWWTDWSSAFSEIARWSTKANAQPQNVIRARWAITTRFNPKLDSLVQIILTKPVYGWKGIAQHQNDPSGKVAYLGGGEQLYVPNLVKDRDALACDFAYLHCFTAIASLM